MRHLGDITKIDWSEVPTVDVVTGGSPCQDLSVAGKRAGLAGERSGLFVEQIRCIKELRKQDERAGRTGMYVRPRYMVWENVPGAFSSGNPKGSDFAAVLEEIVKIIEPEAPAVSVPDKGWPPAGCLYDELGRWSVAWRVHDAQFWGVPQRRKRIALVADFGGLSAPEVLFERKGLHWDTDQSRAQGQRAAEEAEGGVGGASGALNPWDSQSARVYEDSGVWHSLSANEGGGQSRDAVLTGGAVGQRVCYNIGSYHSNAWLSDNPHSGVYEADVSRTLDALSCGAPTCNQGGTAVVETYDARGNGDGQTVCTLTGDHQNRVTDYTALCIGNGQMCNMSMKPIANTPDTMHDQQAIMRAGMVRRLTPLECERLQGYPDGWTLIGEPVEVDVKDYATEWIPGPDCKYATLRDAMMEWSDEIDDGVIDPMDDEFSAFDHKKRGFIEKRVCIGSHKETQHFYYDENGKRKKCSDAARYKALGNSIALPFWKVLARRIGAQYDRDITMGSLFDGIGGFPLVFERTGAKAVWASEIEEFPIAVTKARFKEET